MQLLLHKLTIFYFQNTLPRSFLFLSTLSYFEDRVSSWLSLRIIFNFLRMWFWTKAILSLNQVFLGRSKFVISGSHVEPFWQRCRSHLTTQTDFPSTGIPAHPWRRWIQHPVQVPCQLRPAHCCGKMDLVRVYTHTLLCLGALPTPCLMGVKFLRVFTAVTSQHTYKLDGHVSFLLVIVRFILANSLWCLAVRGWALPRHLGR